MTKYEEPRNSFEAVQQGILPAQGIKLHALSDDAVQSVIYDAYKNSAVQETIYDEYGQPMAHESLCHPVDESGREYPIEAIANHFYDRGLAKEFDNLTCSLGMKKAARSGNVPITLNISVVSALSPDFFKEIEKRIAKINKEIDEGDSEYKCKINPQDIIFEILEHNVNRKADISHLHELKERGYRFALDDFGKKQSHRNRLHVFGGLVDFIKVDGPFIRGYLEDGYEDQTKECVDVITYQPKDLHLILDIIREHYDRNEAPPVPLVAERVRNEEEVKALKPLGFTGFQSRDLRYDDFSCNYDHAEELTIAGEAGICDYE